MRQRHAGMGAPVGPCHQQAPGKMMGGTMWVEALAFQGRGSAFHFTIQAAAALTPARARSTIDVVGQNSFDRR